MDGSSSTKNPGFVPWALAYGTTRRIESAFAPGFHPGQSFRQRSFPQRPTVFPVCVLRFREARHE